MTLTEQLHGTDESVAWGVGYGAHIPSTGSETTASVMLTSEAQSRKI